MHFQTRKHYTLIVQCSVSYKSHRNDLSLYTTIHSFIISYSCLNCRLFHIQLYSILGFQLLITSSLQWHYTYQVVSAYGKTWWKNECVTHVDLSQQYSIGIIYSYSQVKLQISGLYTILLQTQMNNGGKSSKVPEISSRSILQKKTKQKDTLTSKPRSSC